MNHYNHKSNAFGLSWIIVGILSFTVIYLIGYHGAHLAAFLPFAFLLGCAAMHLFMHRGHGKHGNHENSNVSQDRHEHSQQ